MQELGYILFGRKCIDSISVEDASRPNSMQPRVVQGSVGTAWTVLHDTCLG